MRRPAACITILILALGAARSGAEPLTAPPIESPGISAKRLYNGVDREFIIEIHPEYRVSRLELIVINHRGQVLIPKRAVDPGRVNLAEIMPEIWELRRASYLQLIENGQATGPAVVLQPMLSRLVPVTEQAKRSTSGATYTRITGYRTMDSDRPVVTPTGEPIDDADDNTTDGEKDVETNGEPGSTNDSSDNDSSPADEQTDQSSKTQPEPSSSTRAQDDIDTRAARRREKQAEATSAARRAFTGLRAYVEHDVAIETTHGSIVIAMRPDHAPETGWNFMQLARGGFYHDVEFHRIVPATRRGDPFVIQAGDPSATGDGGPGYWLPIEPSGLSHEFGVISMARADDPDSAGSQFFIALSREGTKRLDGQYCAFGEMIDGRETIRSIAQVELDDVSAGRPADPPVILEARLVPAVPRKPGVPRAEQHERTEPKEPKPEAQTRPDRVPR